MCQLNLILCWYGQCEDKDLGQSGLHIFNKYKPFINIVIFLNQWIKLGKQFRFKTKWCQHALLNTYCLVLY
jgi:hypothetical protein